jgi:uncharacterized protein YegJ (DUF2314 family)
MKKITLFASLLTSMFSKAQDEGKLILVERENQEMNEAFDEAKKTLDNFIFRATEQKSENEIYGAYIKVVEKKTVEYLWVSDFKKYDNEHFIGVLITKPDLIKQFKKDQTIGFTKDDIYDWQIYNKISDTLEGAFTFKVLEEKK